MKKLKYAVISASFVLAICVLLNPLLFWYTVPDLNLFGSTTNILGAVWFAGIFIYAANKFRSRFPKITALCLAACTGFITLYCLDELNTVLVWLMFRFEYDLFIMKIQVYASMLIAFWTVHHFAKDYFHVGKKAAVMLGVLVAYYVITDLVMVGNYGTIMYRFMPSPDKQISFWTSYTLCKVYWSSVFLSLWKKKVVENVEG